MKHAVSPGVTADAGRLWLEIRLEEGRLTICGVEGPKVNGDCRGSCGQCGVNVAELSEGWTDAMVTVLAATWDRWHLNDMRAGSPVQESWLRAHPIKAVYPESHYEKASAALEEAGLNPDPDGYSYGHAWKSEAVPPEVSAWLLALPRGCSLAPAWV